MPDAQNQQMVPVSQEDWGALKRRIFWLEDGLRQAEEDFARLGYRGLAEQVRMRLKEPQRGR